MSSAPANSFLWGRRGIASLLPNGKALFTGAPLLQPFRRVIHVPHSTQVVGGVVKEEIITARFPLRVPVHCLGLAQQRLARVYGPGPGAPVGVLKIGSFSTLNLCTGSRSLAGGQAIPKAAKNGNKTLKTAFSLMTRSQKAKCLVPGKILAGRLAKPGKVCTRQDPAISATAPAQRPACQSGLSSWLRVMALMVGGLKRC